MSHSTPYTQGLGRWRDGNTQTHSYAHQHTLIHAIYERQRVDVSFHTVRGETPSPFSRGPFILNQPSIQHQFSLPPSLLCSLLFFFGCLCPSLPHSLHYHSVHVQPPPPSTWQSTLGNKLATGRWGSAMKQSSDCYKGTNERRQSYKSPPKQTQARPHWVGPKPVYVGQEAKLSSTVISCCCWQSS